ncbi:MAG: hypothetical protein V4773_11165 [Verrucomicrobiota bacterium]
MKPPLLLLWLLLVFSVRAEEPAQVGLRLAAEAEAVINTAIAAADRIVVAVPTSATASTFLWESSETSDLRSLDGAFKLTPLRVRTNIKADGTEYPEVLSSVCFCYGQLIVTLKKKDETLIRLLILHGHSVAGENLPFNQYPFEKERLAPFYDRMMALAQKSPKKASP